MPRPASSFRISASVSIFLSCVASSRSPFCCLSLSSSIALSCTPDINSRSRSLEENRTHLLGQVPDLLRDRIEPALPTRRRRNRRSTIRNNLRSGTVPVHDDIERRANARLAALLALAALFAPTAVPDALAAVALATSPTPARVVVPNGATVVPSALLAALAAPNALLTALAAADLAAVPLASPSSRAVVPNGGDWVSTVDIRCGSHTAQYFAPPPGMSFELYLA